MPRLSIRLIRLALLCLALGATTGAWRLAFGGPADITAPHLRALHRLLLLDGWLIPFVIGTANWMLPKHPGAASHGDQRIGGVGLGLFVSGIVAGAWVIASPVAGAGGMLPAGMRLAGCGCWLVMLWPRIKPFGTGRPSQAR